MQKKPVVTGVRTPTDTWSGLSFSKWMPAETVKERRSVNLCCYISYLNNYQLEERRKWAYLHSGPGGRF
ncbi:hypothetical protein PHYPO_G00241990 [Pangasianodon hypophthalmus]|uniref:Uncharacterized protein n=1 Tax=Pangasianodon hypophthalmus TaxID=310915 RepID=A0A5N5NE39_PANHP|nr:hypothetical protein PHYPO_G00241990 [Pangasianodon hypophthalmus]